MSFDIEMDLGVEIPEVLQSGPVIAALLSEKTRLSLRVKSKDRTAIAKSLGLTLPVKIGKTSTQDDLIVACLGPDEWIIIGDQKKYAGLYDKALKLSDKYVMSVTDVSYRNIGVALNGTSAAEMVNVGCPLDLRIDAFPVGKCTRTVFEASPILLHRTGQDSFVMECWRSFAPYMIGLMTAHARGNI